MKNRQPDISDEDLSLWNNELKTVQKTKQPEEPPSAPLYINEITPTIKYQNIPNIFINLNP